MKLINLKAIKYGKPVWEWVDEGKYVDLWTGFHFLIPMGAAYLAKKHIGGIGPIGAYTMISLALIGYELIEPHVWPYFHETPENQIIDMIVGCAGAAIGASI